jgi:type I restriction enzyme S subunit
MPEVITNNLDLWTSALLTKSTAGRGSNGKLEAYGIKKLRELILELAVRGKLVQQDENDEAASVLLEKIAKEKARLIKEGVIKNEKSLPSISNEEIPFNVPDGWTWQRLGQLGFTQTGGTPSKTNKEYFGNDIPFIKPGDIYPDYVDYDNEGLSNEGAKALGRTATAGSILMVCIGTIGKCNIIEKTCAFNQQINSISPYVEMGSYLLTALSSTYFQKTAWENSSSTTIAILNKGKWMDIVVPIPPLAEQHRIVAKVDELMALCDQLEQQQTDSLAAHQTLVASLLGTLTRVESQQEFSAAWARIASHFDTLFTTEASIDQLKQTILQLAVMGKLVPQDPNDEPAEALYARIQRTRDELVKSGAIKRVSVNPNPTEGECDSLPTGWLWSRLGNVFDVRDGTHDTPKYTDEGFPLVTSKNIYTGRLSFDGAKLISEKDHRQICERSRVDRGDILFAMIGSIGNPVIVDTDREFSIKNVALFKYYAAVDAEPRYLLLYLNLVADEMREKSAGGVQSFVSLGFLRNYLFPLPPIAEQHRIVAKVDELMALCDTLKARLADAQTIQLHLADAIVEVAVA